MCARRLERERPEVEPAARAVEAHADEAHADEEHRARLSATGSAP